MHKNIQIITSQELETQIIYLELSNDFSTEKLRLYMHGTSPSPEWKLVLIIIMSIIGAAILAAGGFYAFKFWKARRSGGMVE
jgi:hypothetical protein